MHDWTQKGFPDYSFIRAVCISPAHWNRLKDDQTHRSSTRRYLGDSAALVMRWLRAWKLCPASLTHTVQHCWLGWFCMVINHNDVNKNSFHQGPLPMNSNLLQYLRDCWDLLGWRATVRLWERPALHVMYFTSSFPARLLWSKKKHLSGGGRKCLMTPVFQSQAQLGTDGSLQEEQAFRCTARTRLFLLRFCKVEEASKQTRCHCPCIVSTTLVGNNAMQS